MRTALLLLPLFLLLLIKHVDAHEKRTVIVFGDSLSDNGNFMKFLGNGTLPIARVVLNNKTRALYFKGRYTNGPKGNWNDQLSKNLKRTTIANFAFGGAPVCSNITNLPARAAIIPDVPRQVALYLKRTKVSRSFRDNLKESTAIPVIWAGINDVQYVAFFDTSNIFKLPASVTECAINASVALLKSGLDTVVIGTVPPIELTPFVRGIKLDGLIAPVLTAINGALKQGVAKLQAAYPSKKVLLWDINTDIRTGFTNYKALGFKHNLTESCLSVLPGYSSISGSTPEGICKTPNDYIWFDDIHPTSKAHFIVTESFTKFLVDNKLAKASDVVGYKGDP